MLLSQNNRAWCVLGADHLRHQVPHPTLPTTRRVGAVPKNNSSSEAAFTNGWKPKLLTSEKRQALDGGTTKC